MDPKEFENRAIEAFRHAGLRITMPRIEVVRVLAESDSTLNAQSIYERIQARGNRIDLVSVYRTLQVLHEIGLIHHLGVVDGYSACKLECSNNRELQHFVCDRCGKVTEFEIPACARQDLASQVNHDGFILSEMRIELTGQCAQCATAS